MCIRLWFRFCHPKMGLIGHFDYRSLSFNREIVCDKARPAWSNRYMRQPFHTARTGFTLIEVLCVMAIIMILVSLMLPAMAKGLRKARGLGNHLGGPGGIQMRIGEVATNYTRYRLAHPSHGKMNRRTFETELNLRPTAEAWLNLKSVEYRPFAATDPAEQPAIVVYPSDGSGSGEKTVVFTIRDLILP
jgi:prepilin-type N-terminal cleavage/methylation domain-containing protein